MPFSAPLRVTVEIRLGDVDEGAPRADVTRFFRCSEQIALPPRLDLAHGLPIAGDAPANDIDRSAGEGKENWLVMVGVCTHLGCIPLGQQGDFGGWFCPCHGSHYDTAGRIRKGPAPQNLAVPQFEFISDTVIKIG